MGIGEPKETKAMVDLFNLPVLLVDDKKDKEIDDYFKNRLPKQNKSSHLCDVIRKQATEETKQACIDAIREYADNRSDHSVINWMDIDTRIRAIKI